MGQVRLAPHLQSCKDTIGSGNRLYSDCLGPAHFRSAWILFIAIAVDRAPAAIRFEDFASIRALTLVGDAAVAGKVLRLTRSRPNQAGAVWFRDKQPVRSGFERFIAVFVDTLQNKEEGDPSSNYTLRSVPTAAPPECDGPRRVWRTRRR